MRSTRFSGPRRLWVAVAMLPFLAGLAFASASVSFVCEGDLVVRTECCCPVGQHRVSTSSGGLSSLAPASCCDVPGPENLGAGRFSGSKTPHGSSI
jgi:hypothetical protein